MLLTLRSLYERQPLAAETGAFVATGGDVAFRLGRVLSAGAGSFALTGVAADLTVTPAPTSREYALGGLFPTYVQEAGTRDFVLAAAYVDGTFPDALVNYSLSVATGSFTFTGNAATLAIGFPVSTGAFSLTGTATGLRADRRLAVTTGAFTLTGQAATLAIGFPVTTGAFSLTGQAASLRADRRLTVTTGAFTLTGQSAGLTAGATLSTSTGAFTLTGNSAALRADRRLTVATGAFTLTGNAAAFVHNYPLTAQTGSFALTGQAASLRFGRVLSAGIGAFTLTGNDVGLTAPTVTREYALGGILPTFVNDTGRRQYILAAAYLSETATPIPAYSLAVSTGAFTLSGNAAGLYRALRATVTVGAFSLTGNAAGLYRGRLLAAQTGAFTLAGTATSLLTGHVLTAGVGSFALSGNNVALDKTLSFTVETGAFSLTGQAVSFARTYVLSAGTGAFALSCNAAVLTLSSAGEQPAQDTGGGLAPSRRRRRPSHEARSRDGERVAVAERHRPAVPDAAVGGQPRGKLQPERANRAGPVDTLPPDILVLDDGAGPEDARHARGLGRKLRNAVPARVNEVRDRVADRIGGHPQPDGHDVAGGNDRRSGDHAAQEIPPSEDLAHEPILLDQVTNDNDAFLLLAA